MRLPMVALILLGMHAGVHADERREMIQVEAFFIKCDRAKMERILSKTTGATTGVELGEIEKATLLKELEVSKVDILASPRAITRSGKTAVVQSGSEIRYPSAYEPDKTSGKPYPTEFETTQTGVTLMVKPSVVNGRISAKVTAKNIDLKGYFQHPNGPETKEIPPKSSAPWSPVFLTKQLETEVEIGSGMACLLGPIGDEITEYSKGPSLYLLFSARIVSNR